MAISEILKHIIGFLLLSFLYATSEQHRYDQEEIGMINKYLGYAFILIGLYIIVRNNVGVIEGEIIWFTHHWPLFKTFVPCLFVVTGFLIIFLNNLTVLKYAFILPLLDIIPRVYLLSFHLYEYIKEPPRVLLEEPGSTLFIYTLWPDRIMALIDLFLLFYFVRFVLKKRSSINEVITHGLT